MKSGRVHCTVYLYRAQFRMIVKVFLVITCSSTVQTVLNVSRTGAGFTSVDPFIVRVHTNGLMTR